MPFLRLSLSCLPVLCVSTVALAQNANVPRIRVASPDGQIVFLLGDSTASQALNPGVNDVRYAVDFRGKWLMDESVMGLKLEGQQPLGPGMKQVRVQTGSMTRRTRFQWEKRARCGIATTLRW